jgi:hypothetical protein
MTSLIFSKRSVSKVVSAKQEEATACCVLSRYFVVCETGIKSVVIETKSSLIACSKPVFRIVQNPL